MVKTMELLREESIFIITPRPPTPPAEKQMFQFIPSPLMKFRKRKSAEPLLSPTQKNPRNQPKAVPKTLINATSAKRNSAKNTMLSDTKKNPIKLISTISAYLEK